MRFFSRSAAYFIDLGPVRLTVPGWLTPGSLTVAHRELGGGRFLFALDLVHPHLGSMIRQTAEFEKTSRSGDAPSPY